MKLDICIAILNELKYTKKFIDSLFDSTYHDFDLYILDNGSADGSMEWIESLNRENIHVHRFETNKGCSAGWNYALKMGNSDYKVLTQNDIMFSKNWDKHLTDILEANPQYDAAGSVEIEKLACSQADFDKIVDELRNECIIEGAFYIPCILMKQEFLDRTGYFDERFIGGMYEDSDFIKRAHNADLKWCQYGKSIVNHDFGQTSRKHSRVAHNKKVFEEKWKNKECKPSYILYKNKELRYLYTPFNKIKEKHVIEACEKNNIEYKRTRK